MSTPARRTSLAAGLQLVVFFAFALFTTASSPSSTDTLPRHGSAPGARRLAGNGVVADWWEQTQAASLTPIVETLTDEPDYSTLLAAVVAAGLAIDLSAEGLTAGPSRCQPCSGPT